MSPPASISSLFSGPGKGILPALIAALLFFFGLWLCDFPKPMIDDLFYSGAGLNMAGGGGFSNPLAARYFPGLQHFFIYPPVYSYALAGWLKIFGVSAAAMTGFQITMYFLLSASVIAVLRKNSAPKILGWLVPLIAAGALLENGLRTEALGIALTWMGFAVVECGNRKALAAFTGFLLMFLAGATSPRVVSFDVALIALAAVRVWQEPRSGAKWRTLLPAAAAFAAAVLIFLLMINFRLAEFLQVFHEHSQSIKFKKGEPMWTTHKIFLAVAAAGVLFAWRLRRDHLVQMCVAIAAAMCVAIFTATLSYGYGGSHALLLLLFGMAIVMKQFPHSSRFVVPWALGLVLLWRNAGLGLQLYGMATGHIMADRGDDFAAARKLTSTPAHPLLVDPFVARYTFDYRPPPGSIDFAFSAHFPYVGTVMAELMSRTNSPDIYLLNPRFRDYVERSTYLAHEPRERWTILDRTFDVYPCKVYIVNAADCKALKSAIERPF